MGKKVLVTGGCGFIGSHTVDSLIARGDDVLVIDDLSVGKKSQLNPKAKLVVADVRSAEARKAAKDFGPELVVLTAAQMSVKKSMDDPRFDVDVNIVGLVNILEAFPKNSPQTPYIVFLSTGGAMYGLQSVYPASEAHPAKPESIYGMSKLVSEQYLDFWSRTWGAKFTALRLGNVYGPRQDPHGEAGVVAIFARKLLAKEAPTINGDGTITRDYVYVKDVVSAIISASTAKSDGIYNIGTGKETSVTQIFSHLNELTGANVKPNYGPFRAGDSLRVCIDPSKAGKTFGWAPKYDVATGLKESVEWFSTNK